MIRTAVLAIQCVRALTLLSISEISLFAMQRVINRKLYDTESAEQIARYARNTDQRDFNYFVETLYKTEDGEYFLHGRGGPNTKYSRRVNGGTTGSEEITVLDENEALNWCEKRSIDGKTVVEEFNHLIET